MRVRSVFGFQSVAMYIIAINIIVFALQAILGDWFTASFMFVSEDVLARPWILITHMFLHAGAYHLLFNMYGLLIFGPLIEQKIGSKRFLFIYFLSGIVAVLPYTLFSVRSLGASAALMGIIGVTVMLIPNLRLLLFFAIPMTLRTAAIIFVILDMWGIFFSPGVANFAHLVGLACGLAFGYYLLKKRKGFAQRFTSKPRRIKEESRHKGIELSRKDMEDYLKYGRL